MNAITSFFKGLSPLSMGILAAIVLFFVSTLLSGNAFAGFGVDESLKLKDANGQENLKDSIITMLNYFLGFVGVLLVVIIVYAGFLIIVSQGEEEELTKGRTMIVYAIIGVVIIFLSYTIVNFIGDVTDSNKETAATG